MSSAPAKQPLDQALADHHAFVRERLRCLGVAAADLDDATQDVFEVLVRRIADHDPARPLRAWMAGIARKVARRYRDRGRRTVIELSERASPDASPEERASQAEAWVLLERFVAQLDPDRWAVFVLSEIEGLRGSEIAAELGINQNTVYARLRSARAAFERSLKRQHARERRGVFVLFGWPRWRWSAPAKLVMVAGVVVGPVLVLGVGGTSCSHDESTSETERPHTEVDAEVPPAGSVGGGVGARPSDPAGTTPRSVDTLPEAWTASGSHVALDRNAADQGYTLSSKSRYRLDGDRIVYERTYVGDDEVAVDSVDTELRVDGLALVDGELIWDFGLEPGETKIVTTTLEATRAGVVSLEVAAPHGSTRLKLMFEHGRLRRCKEHECDAPESDKERRSGERVHINVSNRCEVAKEFVLFAGYPAVLPPDDVTVYTLQPDETRVMEIDAAQWFLNRDEDGHIGGGVQIADDGARVIFSGTGDDCSTASAMSADLPPDAPPPPFPPPFE